jgi:hypothetical protein
MQRLQVSALGRLKLRHMHYLAFRKTLQGRALCELRSLEETSAALSSAIQEGQLAKQQLVDDMVEAERQIMLAERKIQLEREMQVRPGCIAAKPHIDSSLEALPLASACLEEERCCGSLGGAVLLLLLLLRCRRCWTRQLARAWWQP